jgi:hypothetical protein
VGRGQGAWGKRAKRTQFRRPAGIRRADHAKRTQTWGDWDIWPRAVIVYGPTSPDSGMCETNPIREGNRAKRTQFGGTCRAKRTQFLDCGLWIGDCGLGTDLRRDAGPAAYGGQNAQNKPNSQRTRYPIIPLFYHSTIPVRCRLCRTNPISRRGRVGRGLGDEGRTCKTNPISGGTEWDEGQTCKTNPISERGPICLR